MSELRGFEAFIAALRAIPERVMQATPDALTKAAHHLEEQIQVELSRTSHAPGTPTPSPPGSPPSLVSGNLHRSIQVDGPTMSGGNRWTVKVGSGVVYAAVQERGGNHLPARPYMAPGLAAALPGMGTFFEQAWADAIH